MTTEHGNEPRGTKLSGNGNGSSPLTLVISGTSLLFSIGFGFYTVANPKGDFLAIKSEYREDLRRTEDRLDREIISLNKNTVGVPEHKEFLLRTDNGIATLKGEIDRIRADQVTRAEHTQHWAEIQERITAARELVVDLRKSNETSLNDIRKEVGGQYTLGDQIKSLQDQIKQLTTRLDTMKHTTTPN